MIRTWKFTKNKAEEIRLTDNTSLDTITRQLPEGYYSTFRTYDGCTRVLGLKTHLQRLPDLDAFSLRRHLIQLVGPYRPGEARVRVMETKEGEVYLSIEPLKPMPREVYEKGVHAKTTAIKRDSPRLKSTAFIGQSEIARRHVIKSNIFEALLTKNKRILEGMTSNFFYVLPSTALSTANVPHSKQGGGLLYTAQRDVLLGVTRRTVIRVARGMGIEIRYVPLKLEQLPDVDEAFITSSSRGVVPVVQIDDVMVGQGKVGVVTRLLMSAYHEYVLKAAEKIFD